MPNYLKKAYKDDSRLHATLLKAKEKSDINYLFS